MGSVECCLHAARVMESTLCLGGWFIVKHIGGGEVDRWRTYLSSRFKTVRSIRPKASKWVRLESFCICRGFLGRHPISEEVLRPNTSTRYEGFDLWANSPPNARS